MIGFASESRCVYSITHSQPWASVLDRVDLGPRRIQLADISELITSAAHRPGSIAIIEIDRTNVEKTLKNVIPLINNPFQLCRVAVGNIDLKDWLPLIRIAGFAAFYSSVFQASRIERLVAAHFATPGPPWSSLEQVFATNLPWQPLPE